MILTAIAVGAPVVEPEPLDALVACTDAAGPTLRDPVPARTSRLAVVVGVPCHDDPSIPSLRYASTDAVAMGVALGARGFDVVRLTTHVTRSDLLRTLRAAREALLPGGMLTVYLSGHGVLHEREGGLDRYFVLSDSDLGDIADTGLALSDLEGVLARFDAAQRLVIQDTCYASGENGKGLGGLEGAKALGVVESRLGPEDTRLYASRFYEVATESPERGGSVYTTLLLDALEDPTADLDGDGCTGWSEAHQRAAERTTEVRRGFQHPVWSGRAMPSGCAGPTHAVRVGEGLTAVEPGRIDGVKVQAGDWFVPSRRSWRGWLGLVVAAHSWRGSVGGLELMGGARRPTAVGTVALGASVGVALPGRTTTASLGIGTAALRAGVDWGGALHVGPRVELGMLGVEPIGVDLPTQAAPLLGAAVRSGYRLGQLDLGVELGVRAVPDGGRAAAIPRAGLSVVWSP